MKSIKEILEKHNCYSLDLDLDLQQFLKKHDDIMFLRIEDVIIKEYDIKIQKLVEKIFYTPVLELQWKEKMQEYINELFS
jgi:hypothetical protein